MPRLAAITGVVLALTAPAAAAAAAETAMVTGTVRIDGPVAPRPPLPVYKHREVCGDGVPDDRLVVSAAGGLRYAVVSIEGVHGGRRPERDVTIDLDNRGCRFEPHVQTAEVGQWLELRNSDPILHNADARIGSDTLFNVALPPGRRVRKPLARPGLVAITCDVRHTWMRAYVVVADDPYHTVTDAAGEYEIRDVPPGHYTLRVWHEELGVREQPIVVEAGKPVAVDVHYPAPTAAPEAPR
jgi:plastocyanin